MLIWGQILMGLRGRTSGLAFVAALATAQLVAMSPAAAIGVPVAPAKPAVVAGNASARVTWVAPADNGSPIDQYTVTPYLGAVAQAPRVFNNTLVTEVITGLVNGTAYTFKVKAHNAVGTGADSVASSSIVVGAPVAPAKPTTVPGALSARVTWVAPMANGSAVNQYVVTPYIGMVAQAPRVFNNTLVTEVITGLVNGTTYTFRVKAHNVRGTGADSVGSDPVTVGAPVAPATPTVSPGAASVRVTWVAPADNGAAIDQYTVTPYLGLVAQAPRVFNNTLVTEVITGLVDGSTYTFRVKGHNVRGTGPNSAASPAVKAGAPVAPAQPKVGPGNGQARVSWAAPANNGSPINGYVVTPFVGAVAQVPRTFNTAALVQDVTGLTNGTSYTFKVAGRNARGVGPSSVASAVVAPTTQPSLQLVMNATIGQPILVNSAGMTVYLFDPDGADTTSHVNGTLRVFWPYVTWSGPVTVGAGLTLASATANVQPDNTRLLGYHGHLLYTFLSDHVPGDVTGQGVAQFFVLDASGNKIP
ncbi:MAG: hypothetical protein JWM05_1456 [Acidimicrobiales bacterium]|nr:hypothetical protein [Acidimicrobiales bacterium]